MSLENRSLALVEDDPIMGESLVQRLRLEGAKVSWWRTGADALLGLSETSPDAVICDVRLPDRSGVEFFRQIARGGRAPPFLFITGYGDIKQAVELMRDGARDYLTKPFVMSEFLTRLEQVLGPPEPEGASTLGVSPAMREVERNLSRIARRQIPVLILGETGVGKEVCARYLHEIGAGRRQPFIAVNCAAIPSELVESEIFGHEKGAFTGATALHRGYAERAGEGTLFLDEVGDLPLAMQAKLLRLLEDRSFSRVGGEHLVPFKARVVCATNADLSSAIQQGRFREDLYYRINAFAISIPPLARRKEDIPWLTRRLLDELRDDAGSTITGLSPLAEQAALEHPWPGNVRELRNRLERAMVMASGPCLLPGDLFPETFPPAARGGQHVSLRSARDEAERRHIERTLQETGGQLSEAARILDISRTTLWEKMKRHGIVIPDDA
jgi:DNA-binding NtrC family response regulator